MKLLSKTNRYYFFYSALLLLAGSLIFFFIISNVIQQEVSEVLTFELHEYVQGVESEPDWQPPANKIEFEMYLADHPAQPDTFAKILIPEDEGDELVPYLQLDAYRLLKGKLYHLVLRESLIEAEGILFGISVSLIVLFLILLIGLILLNNYLSRVLWQPFYRNLENIRAFNLSEAHALEHTATDIDEFKELSQALEKMTSRIKLDYLSLKEFTENASHELQTPLAIIKTNIDCLLQEVSDAHQLKELENIERAVNRISRTNQALLFLTKIENHQFTQLECLQLETVIRQTLEEFGPIIQAKNLQLRFTVSSKPEEGLFNKTLIQVLVSNLLSNAVRHNIPGGFISIYLTKSVLIFENSGKPLAVPPARLFERFAKANPAAESTGLGLSIIEKICQELGFSISYTCPEDRHCFTIKFSSEADQEA